MFDTVLGLPAHPLLVHVPVVMIPVTLLLALASLWPGRARRGLALATAVVATVAVAGAQLAVMTGESLEERVDESSLIPQHADAGELTPTIATVVFVAAWVYALRVWDGHLGPALQRVSTALRPRAAGAAVVVVLLVAAVACTVAAARTGHLGAESAWGDLPPVSVHAGGER